MLNDILLYHVELYYITITMIKCYAILNCITLNYIMLF